jgi:hypothetical protein
VRAGSPLGATVTATGRYGYPGFLLGLATNQVSARTGTTSCGSTAAAGNGWTVFLFGARDELDTPAPTRVPDDPNPPLEPALFPRLSPPRSAPSPDAGTARGTYRAVLGYDRT